MTPGELKAIEDACAGEDVPALVAEVRHLQRDVLYLRRMMWLLAAAGVVMAVASIISRL